MRRYIVIGHEAPTDPDFPIDDLPGGAGRLDVLCRAVSAGLLHSHGIRSHASVTTLHGNEFAIRFDGETVRRLNPDERSTAARFREALARADEAVGMIEVEVSPGVTIARRTLERYLTDLDVPLVKLDPTGVPITELSPDQEYAFVLSDHRNFSSADAAVVNNVARHDVSLGPLPIHADQAITIVQNYLDTKGYREYGVPS